MLTLLREYSASFGPLRLFGSHLVLASMSAVLAAVLSWKFLPCFFAKLPRDGGKKLVADGAISKGKPTGAGLVMSLFALVALALFLPLRGSQWLAVLSCVLISGVGFLDDRSSIPWGRLKKGLLDVIPCALAAWSLCQGHDVQLWWPFVKGVTSCHPAVYMGVATFILWVCVNGTNCSDGVDGLVGSLSMISLLALSAFLYGVVGHEEFARYFLIPHNPDGARWAILCMAFTGAIGGYLWHNAHPSDVLMGDAGSRAIGLLMGVASLATGNLLFVFVVGPVVLINGLAGLVKITLLKVGKRLGCNVGTQENPPTRGFFKYVRAIRTPLHDFCKTRCGWKIPQVLMRFVLLQALTMPLLFALFVKVR